MNILRTDSLISIIIPTYNRAELISKTLNSIQKQYLKYWECIIVDDFSTDNTREVIKQFTDLDSRFQYFTNIHKKGACGARNSGLEIANGDYIVFFDSDNLMHPNYLSVKLEMFKKSLNVDVITSFSKVKNDENVNVGLFTWQTEGNIFIDLIRGKTYVDTSSAMIKRDFLSQNCIWDEDLVSYQELDFHLTLSKNGANYKTCWDFLTDYYRRNVGTISNDSVKNSMGRLYIYCKWLNDYKVNKGLRALAIEISKIPNWNLYFTNSGNIINNDDFKYIKKIIKMNERKELVKRILNKILRQE